ncbi:MAG: aminoacyl-tRNA hydrolase [Bacteroidota bacterium]
MKYCLVGLGNPGSQYNNTRHNIGFEVINAIGRMYAISFKKNKVSYYSQITYQGNTIYLVKPSLYMNRSGEPVLYWLRRLQISLGQLLIIADDLHLPIGKLRMRGSGGSGGHNGLKDITNQLKSDQYPRIRLGIGKNYLPGEQSEYVLGHFSAKEQIAVESVIQSTVETIFLFCTEGIQAAMSKYNSL